MKSRLNHLVFYDGTCGFCNQIVQFLLKVDRYKIFVFAPLKGSTANQHLKNMPKDIDSIILVEDFCSHQPHLYIMSQAVFRICWLLGKRWTLIGWLFFLPSLFFDWSYLLVTRYRYFLFPQKDCVISNSYQKERFLP